MTDSRCYSTHYPDESEDSGVWETSKEGRVFLSHCMKRFHYYAHQLNGWWHQVGKLVRSRDHTQLCVRYQDKNETTLKLETQAMQCDLTSCGETKRRNNRAIFDSLQYGSRLLVISKQAFLTCHRGHKSKMQTCGETSSSSPKSQGMPQPRFAYVSNERL
jgi:hypothetical protein